MALKPLLLMVALLQSQGGPTAERPTPRAARTAPAVALSHDGSARELEVVNPWVASAEIRLDGRLDDAAWADAPRLHGFTQYEPLEGVAASQRTEVRVLVTDDAVYFGVEAFDDTPGGIRAAPPAFGGNTCAILSEFGYSTEEIRVLEEKGVV